MLKRIILVILSCFLFISCSKKEDSNLIETTGYYRDTEENTTINSIHLLDFKPLKNPKLSANSTVFWFKLKLKENKLSNLVIDIKNSTLQAQDIKVFAKGREISFRNIGLVNPSLLIEENISDVYFLRIRCLKQAYFLIKAFQRNSFEKQEQNNFFINGGLAGFAVMVFLVNLFFYYTFKDSTFLFYNLFLVSINLAVLDLEGLFGLIASFKTGYFLNLILHYLVPFTGFLFAYKFLDLKIHASKIKPLSYFFFTLTALFYGLYIYSKVFVYFAIGDLLSFLHLFFYWAIGVWMLKKHRFAVFFVLGYSLILFSGILYLLPVDFGLTFINIDLTAVKIGALFEMLILTYATAYRVKIMQKENTYIKKQIALYLNQLFDLKNKSQKNESKTHYSIQQKVDNLTTKHQLTKREVDVLLTIAKGYTNQKIAEELDISLNTVKYHTRNIYQKLNIQNKTEAIKIVKN